MTVRRRILDIWLNRVGGLLRISFISLNYYPPDIQLTWQTRSADMNVTKHECMYMWRITDRIFSQCMSGSGGYQSDIHSVYEWVRRITEQIVIRGRWLMDWIFIVCIKGSGGYWSVSHLWYAGVRRLTNWISNRCIQGSGGLPIN